MIGILIINLVIYLNIFFSEFFQQEKHPKWICDNNSLLDLESDDDSYSINFVRFNFNNEKEHAFNPIFLKLDNIYMCFLIQVNMTFPHAMK